MPTTLHIRLDDSTARRLEAQSARAGLSLEAYAQSILAQRGETWDEFVQRNGDAMRSLGAATPEAADAMIAEWTREERHGT